MYEKYNSNIPDIAVDYLMMSSLEDPIREFYDSMTLEEKRELEIQSIKAEKPKLPEITIDNAAAA